MKITVFLATDDYAPGPYYANFTAHTTSAEVCINIIDDNELECEEVFSVCIANGSACSEDQNATREIRIKDQCKILYILYNRIQIY